MRVCRGAETIPVGVKAAAGREASEGTGLYRMNRTYQTYAVGKGFLGQVHGKRRCRVQSEMWPCTVCPGAARIRSRSDSGK